MLFDKFSYKTIPLDQIKLDSKNPRIVTDELLDSESEMIAYLFEHEDLLPLMRKIARQGKNIGAERPYVIGKAPKFTVIEGNTRIAAYKLLTGLSSAPADHEDSVPTITEDEKTLLLTVDCTVSPNRAMLLPIMADAHFGTGDKSKWGYLGSRKIIYQEWKDGKSLTQIARIFDLTKTGVIDYLLEYQLYLKARTANWAAAEKARILDPNVKFNPPVRFLQTSGHKEKVGVELDRTQVTVKVQNQSKFRHLIKKLVIESGNKLGATSSYDAVFKDYIEPSSKKAKGSGSGGSTSGKSSNSSKSKSGLNSNALYAYDVTRESALLKQLMKESKTINANKLPSAAALLLRSLIEAILKDEIRKTSSNKDGKSLTLASALGLVHNKSLFTKDDRAILKDFQTQHLSYLNLTAHANTTPNAVRVFAIRDLVDAFVQRSI